MDQVDLSSSGITSLNTQRSTAIAKLLGSSNLTQTDDKLMAVLSKSRSDTVKWTQHMLEKKLTTDLNTVLSDHVAKYPEMKNKFFVGILSDDKLRTEVVAIDDAVKAVSDASAEDARAKLSASPLGYFKAADFTMTTKQEPGYKELKTKLDTFFQKHSDLIAFMRAHPEFSSKDSDFYTALPS